jgi:hypothetical protein
MGCLPLYPPPIPKPISAFDIACTMLAAGTRASWRRCETCLFMLSHYKVHVAGESNCNNQTRHNVPYGLDTLCSALFTGMQHSVCFKHAKCVHHVRGHTPQQVGSSALKPLPQHSNTCMT